MDRTRSSGPTDTIRSTFIMLEQMLYWDSMTPFANPVVPEV